MPDRIGIFGGSFNPLHVGHLALAKQAREELSLRKVVFVPSYQTPLKDPSELLPSALRVRCLKAALRSKKGLEVSTLEVRGRKRAYTVDTLRKFRKKFGPGTVLYFLAGADALKNLSRWKSPRKMLELCRFVVCSRPGSSKDKLPSGVHYLPMVTPDISASEIRRRMERSLSLRGWVPSECESILRDHQRKVWEKKSTPRRRSL